MVIAIVTDVSKVLQYLYVTRDKTGAVSRNNNKSDYSVQVYLFQYT